MHTHTHTHTHTPVQASDKKQFIGEKTYGDVASGLGASLASPHSYNALLPASVSAAVHQDLGLASRANECSFPVSHLFCCAQVVRAVGSGLTPSVLFLAPTMSSDPRLGTACLPTVLSPLGWSRWPCLTLTLNLRSLIAPRSNKPGSGCWSGWGWGGTVGRGQFTD